MQVGIVGQRGNSRAQSLAEAISERLGEAGTEVVVDEETAAALGTAGVPTDALADCDLVVSIGGDGTFLFAARGAGTTPIMGVNLGEVGFLNAVSPEDAVEAVAAEVRSHEGAGDATTHTMPRIEANGDGWTLAPAINEMTVMGERRGHGHGVGIEVRVDGSLYTSGQADGVIVATPTGSTAYNLSEGGPLVHPGVDSLVVTEMCAEGGMPPLVVGEDSEVTVGLEGAPEAVVVSDGRVREMVEPPTRVTLRRAPDPVHVAGPPLDFFTALGKLD